MKYRLKQVHGGDTLTTVNLQVILKRQFAKSTLLCLLLHPFRQALQIMLRPPESSSQRFGETRKKQVAEGQVVLVCVRARLNSLHPAPSKA